MPDVFISRYLNVVFVVASTTRYTDSRYYYVEPFGTVRHRRSGSQMLLANLSKKRNAAAVQLGQTRKYVFDNRMTGAASLQPCNTIHIADRLASARAEGLMVPSSIYVGTDR